MNLEQLLARYAESPNNRLLTGTLAEKPLARFLLEGLWGSQLSLAVSAAFKSLRTTHLIVAADSEEAAFWQNDIANLLEKPDVLFFPDSFRRPQRFEEISRNHVLQRTEAVERLVNSPAKGSILVTYPEALFEKVVAPQFLKKSAVEIVSKNKLDTDFLLEVLLEYGFERREFVYEPGQFSIRGGIIDIYSYGNELPYRVELFDDEVESIRAFNPTTQLSERNLARVTIVPNINTRFEAAQKTSLLRLLPEGTLVWVKDMEFLIDRLQSCFEAAAGYADKIQALRDDDRTEEAGLLEERAFLMPRDVMTDLQLFPIAEIAAKPYFRDALRIVYKSRPQPSFNKNFDLLIKTLTENDGAGYENVLFAENPKQIRRFYSIFEDLKATMRWFPVPKALHQGFFDDDLRLACFTDHQIFDRYHRYKQREGFEKDIALTLRRLKELQPGDYVTHLDHGVGRYSGLEKINLNGQVQEAVRLIYRDHDILYVSINSLHKISKYVGKDGEEPKIHKLGTDAWTATKRKAKAKIKELAFDLIQLYAKRRATKAHQFPPDNYLQNELEASFIYEDTPDQAKATEDVKRDMEKDYPMDRLVCGDVGFGKTEVAIRAAFKAVTDGKQVAILVPTTILALQHHRTFSERLQEFGADVAYLNRFCTTKERNEVYKKLESGELDIVIGTHALLNQKVKFKDLGLLIIDEEQKFGVNSKEKIRNMKVNVDTLTLTATPIPRTLQFSLMAARDLSVINTPPPNRQPIHTEVRVFSDELIKESIYHEVARGGQVFFLHNRVQQLADMAAMLKRLCPDVDFAVAHGQMEAEKLEEVLLEFIEGQHDVLVCTNIIETGLDIPNANTIIINQAHHFGLSDLHQLRGRVGRSNKKAYCYLFCPPKSTLTQEARKRLEVIEQFSELGSGFQIAMRDLDIRGAGNILGAEQSGFIVDIGYETYQKILEEAIRELKQSEYRDLFSEDLEAKFDYVREVAIETDVEMLIPDEFVHNVQERLSLYTELDNLENEEALQQFGERLADRFGKLPRQVLELFQGLRLRWTARELGMERIVLKNQKLRCHFLSNPQSPFYETERFHALMAYISRKTDHRFHLKQSEKALILAVDGVKGLAGAFKVLQEVRANCGE
jgi:transcription-repair coupling factor (superfamily II helicase)